MKKLTAFLLCAIMLFSFAACKDEKVAQGADPAEYLDMASEEATHIAVIELKNGNTIALELYGNTAPITVTNFNSLVEENFYDGLIFHRVIENFMIQGGDPEGNGTGGSDKEIIGEFAANGIQNDISHDRGVISMARSNDPNSASSQFFICHKDSPHLNGSYAAFGRVIAGMETVDEIAVVETDMNDKPLKSDRSHVVL